MIAMLPRRNTHAWDPLGVAETKAKQVAETLAGWRLHIAEAGPHDAQKCRECLRFYKQANEGANRIGFSISETMIRGVQVCEREGCGNEFIPVKHWQRYCSDSCRVRAHRERN